MTTRADKHKATGDYVSVVIRDPVARKALEDLASIHGSKRAAIEAALIASKPARKRK